MKKLLLFAAAVLFLASCSQYTCPTYSKAPAPKKVENKI